MNNRLMTNVEIFSHTDTCKPQFEELHQRDYTKFLQIACYFYVGMLLYFEVSTCYFLSSKLSKVIYLQ